MEGKTPHLLRGRAEAIVISKLPPPAIKPKQAISAGEAIAWRSFLARWGASSAAAIMILPLFGLAPHGITELGAAAIDAFNPIGLFDSPKRAPVLAYADASVKEPEIVIPAIGVHSVIVEPPTSDLQTLEAALAEGAVHYPGSAEPGETGNFFILGHSTGLPVVKNDAFKVFNRVKELHAGDAIKIREGNREYLYLISKISVKKASEARVDLAIGKRMLTLVTCKLIGAAEEEYRYVVEAEFLRSYPLRIPLAEAR